MKMMGKVVEYNQNELLGYIEGYDDIVYMFHQNNVIDKTELKKGDLVKYNFKIINDENMPSAIDIEKI